MLIPVVNRLQPSSGLVDADNAVSSDRWIAWQMFSCHTAFHRSSTIVRRMQSWYRIRLRRYVLVHRDRVLDVVSSAAELESDVLQVHYSELSPFLVRPTQAEMERLVRSETQRRVQLWEKVRRVPNVLSGHGISPRTVTGTRTMQLIGSYACTTRCQTSSAML